MHAPPFAIAHTVEEALSQLAALGPQARPLAGATWTMRAPLRGEQTADRPLVALGGIAELHQISRDAGQIALGALVTHDALASWAAEIPALAGLASAAGKSANPGVRRLATLGGNLATQDFAAADLPPALLVLEAEVELATEAGRSRLPLADYLATRASAPGLITRVVCPDPTMRTAHARLPMRVAGDYPCAILSLAARMAPDGTVAEARVAVGAVDPVARRWSALEQALTGQRPDPELLRRLASEATGTFTPRDGPDVPAAYRLQVLPALLTRAFAALLSPAAPEVSA